MLCKSNCEKLLYCDGGFVTKLCKKKLDYALHESVIVLCIQVESVFSNKAGYLCAERKQCVMDEG